MFDYDENNCWLLEKNKHNSGNLNVGPFTVKFPVDYFKPIDDPIDDNEFDSSEHIESIIDHDCYSGSNYTDDDDSMDHDYIMDDEEWEEFRYRRPIKGLSNDYYTADEALGNMWFIAEKLANCDISDEKCRKLEEELEHFKKELQNFDLLAESDQTYTDLVKRSQLYKSLRTYDENSELLGFW